jgi:hypothetical protein
MLAMSVDCGMREWSNALLRVVSHWDVFRTPDGDQSELRNKSSFQRSRVRYYAFCLST